LVVQNADVLRRLIEDQGYRVKYSPKKDRFYVKDPRTGREEIVSRDLNELARMYFERQKAGSKPSNPGEAGLEQGSVGDVDVSSLAEETKFLVSQLRQRLDPKLPIMTKFVSDTSWWLHLRLDFTRLVLPELFSMMSKEEIDIANPEVTARNMASKVLALKAEASRARELEDKLRALTGEFEARLREEVSRVESKYAVEVEALKAKLREYEGVIATYDTVVRGLADALATLAGKAERTMRLVSRFIAGLPEDVRGEYEVKVAPRIREIWGGGG